MRTKAMTWLAALALLTLAPVAAQETGFESEAAEPIEAEATAETTPEPVAPEAVELDAAVPEPAVEETTPALEETAPAAESAYEPMAEETSEELPRTASPLALLALLGLGSTASALGLRSARRR